MREARTTCLVPGCSRSTAKPHDEWICGKHWRAVPRAARLTLSSIARRYRRQFGENGYWTFPAGSEKRLAAVEADREWRAAWAACRDAAVAEHFMGAF